LIGAVQRSGGSLAGLGHVPEMKSAGEKTAIQSSTDGLVQPYFTVTHSVSSPCQILKFEKQHVMYTVK